MQLWQEHVFLIQNVAIKVEKKMEIVFVTRPVQWPDRVFCFENARVGGQPRRTGRHLENQLGLGDFWEGHPLSETGDFRRADCRARAGRASGIKNEFSIKQLYLYVVISAQWFQDKLAEFCSGSFDSRIEIHLTIKAKQKAYRGNISIVESFSR